MGYENLSPEQQERARACENPADLGALAAEEGLELSDEMLEDIAGGEGDVPVCKKRLHLRIPHRPETNDEERLDCHGFYLN